MIDKKSPILIIGFGSIGRRHYKNLLDMGYKNIQVFDTADSGFQGMENISRIKKINQETAKNYRVVFICSPNNSHIKHALVCAQAGCQLFIEKPLAHNLKGISELEKICKKKRLVTMVGCNMRFHPCLAYIKRYLDSGKLGKIYNIRHEFGYYLPYWRPNQDYRKNYAAKKSSGGGIILDDIHEFDLLFWLNNFSQVKKHSLLFNRASALKLETEDQATGNFLFKNNVMGSVNCNYLDQHYSRNVKIVGEKGSLEWNFEENIVWLYIKGGRKEIFQIRSFDFNRVYIDEVKYFFNRVKKKEKTFNSLEIAARILKYCLV